MLPHWRSLWIKWTPFVYIWIVLWAIAASIFQKMIYIGIEVARKYWAKRYCHDPGSNKRPSDLQSDALPTELSRLRNQQSANISIQYLHYLLPDTWLLFIYNRHKEITTTVKPLHFCWYKLPSTIFECIENSYYYLAHSSIASQWNKSLAFDIIS